MKMYTRTGDTGETSVIGGRVRKDNIRVEAYGTIDELNSFVGIAMASIPMEDGWADYAERLLEIQHELFDCGSDLAFVAKKDRAYKVTAQMIERLEQWIDEWEEESPPITRFILPGGSELSAKLHVCRTVCRRAERLVVTHANESESNEEVLKYLNRLSDLFFAAARVANSRQSVVDTEYVRSAEVFRNGK